MIESFEDSSNINNNNNNSNSNNSINNNSNSNNLNNNMNDNEETRENNNKINNKEETENLSSNNNLNKEIINNNINNDDNSSSNNETIQDNYKLENSNSSNSVHSMIKDSKEINRTDIRGVEIEDKVNDNDKLTGSIDHENQKQLQQEEEIINEKNQISSTIVNHSNEELSSNLSTFDNFSTTTSNNNDSILENINNNKDDNSTNIEQQFSLSGRFKSLREGRLIENFIVVGLSKDTVINPGEKISNDAKILYNYPPDKPCDPQVVNFCFPDGVKLIQVKRRNSLTEFNSVLYKSLSQLEGSDSSFMFLITGGEHLLYGCCVLNTELINEFPYFFPESIDSNGNLNESSSSSAPPSPYCHFSPRCYCVISRYPFFRAHFDFIYSILGKERLNKVNRSIQELEQTELLNQKRQEEQRLQHQQQRQSHAIPNASSYLSYNFQQEGKSQLSVSQQPPKQKFQDYFFSSDSPKQLSASSNDFSKYLNNNKMRPNKPLPPLPQNNLSKSSYPTPFSPLAISPSDSPVLNSSTEETSLLFSSPQKLGHHRAVSTSIIHNRSHSTPISQQNLNKIVQQHQLNILNSSNSNGNSNSNIASLNNSNHTNLDESLSAIQESLGSDTFESDSDLSSSTNSFQIYNSFNNSSTQFYNSNNSSKFNSPSITNQINSNNINNNNKEDNTEGEQTSPKPLPKLPAIAITDQFSKLLPPPPSGPQLTVEQYLSSSTNSSKTPSPNQSQSITTLETTSSTTTTTTTTTTLENKTTTSTTTTSTTTTITSPPPPLPPKRIKQLTISEESNNNNNNNNNNNDTGNKNKFPNLTDEVIQTIEIFYNTSVPYENQKLIVHYPNEQPLTYEAGDDIFQIEKWCLSGLVKTLSLKTIIQIISCVLLEKFILVTSKNIGIISNTIFGILPLLRPFEYQGAFIPILPNSALDALYCPVPFIIGLTNLSGSKSEMKDALDNCYILDVDKDSIVPGVNCPPILNLPDQDKLEAFIKPFYNEVSKENRKKYSLDYPFKSVPNEFKFIQSISNEFKLYNRFILDSIGFYIDWNPNFDFGNSVHKEQLLRLIHASNLNFIDQFLHSQLFTSHIELLFDKGTNNINNINNNNNNNNSKTITLNTYKTSRL